MVAGRGCHRPGNANPLGALQVDRRQEGQVTGPNGPVKEPDIIEAEDEDFEDEDDYEDEYEEDEDEEE